MKNWTKYSIVIAVAGIALAGYFLLKNSSQPSESSQSQQPYSKATQSPQNTNEPSATSNPPTDSPSAVNPQQQPPPTSPSASAPQQTPPKDNNFTVIYASQGFSPASLGIETGGIVKFVNQSSEPLWVGSDPHPVHTAYPTTGGCINSTFDSCKGIQPGESWSFTFGVKGTWGYHNHLNPGKKGKVIVLAETDALPE